MKNLDEANAIDFFPEGKTPRDAQRDAIGQIDAAFKRGVKVVALEMPTGGGKSWIAQTFARQIRAQGGRSFVLTSQKILQDQYEADFPEPEMVLLKGRNAYPCTHRKAKPDQDCSKGVCKKQNKSLLPECVLGRPGRDGADDDEVQAEDMRAVVNLEAPPERTSCPYWAQACTANQSDVTLFNFSSFLYQQRIGRFGRRDLLIVDEAHNIEPQLMSFVELEMWENDLKQVSVEFSSRIRSGKDLSAFIEGFDIVNRIKGRLEELGNLEGAARVKASMSDRDLWTVDVLEKLHFKLEVFQGFLDKAEWVIEVEDRFRHGQQDRVLICRPLYAKGFARDLLFGKADRALCVSATLLSKDVWAKNLGLEEKEVEFVKLGSDFPVENRTIHLEYAGSMNWNDKDATIPKLVTWLKDVCLKRHAGERGIIHAHSFDTASRIVKGVGDPRLLLHSSGQDKREILRIHEARPDSVIVAPAFHEGVDLKDDLSRFQVIVKVPYPTTQDKVIAARMRDDPEWYSWLTALKIVQSYGRSVRSKEDHAVTYITDKSFDGFKKRAWHLLPVWFKEALR